MTTNAAEANREHFTVADLLAREHTSTGSYPWTTRDRRPRVLMPATELLRREGIHLDGATDVPTKRVHVGTLLRREAAAPPSMQRDPGEPPMRRRAAAIAGAAALCALTIAGLIALKPATPREGANSASGARGDARFGVAPAPDNTVPTATVLKRAQPDQNTNNQPGTPTPGPASRHASRLQPGGTGASDGAAPTRGSSILRAPAPPSEGNQHQTSSPPPEDTTATTTPTANEPSEVPDEEPGKKPKPPHPSHDHHGDGGDDDDGSLPDPVVAPWVLC